MYVRIAGVLVFATLMVIAALVFWGSPWMDSTDVDQPEGHVLVKGPGFEGSMGPAFDDQGCPLSVSLVVQSDVVVTKATLKWRTQTPYEPVGFEPSFNYEDLTALTFDGFWMEATQPWQGKLRFSYSWPASTDWPWAEFLTYSFRLEYVNDKGATELWIVPSEKLLLTCGDPDVPLLVQHLGVPCGCPTIPEWWALNPSLVSPEDGATFEKTGEMAEVTLEWSHYYGTPDWHHAYLLEVRVTDWNRFDTEKDDTIWGDWCFADYYLNGSQGLTGQQFDPAYLDGPCYLVVDLAGFLTTEYTAMFHTGFEYIWRVRAQCCEPGRPLVHSDPSEPWRFRLNQFGSPPPPAECPPCSTMTSMAGPDQYTFADLLSAPPTLTWEPVDELEGAFYQLEIHTDGLGPCSAASQPDYGSSTGSSCWVQTVDAALSFDTAPLGLIDGGYEWKVRAFCPDQLDCPTAWSDETKFFIES